MPASTNARCACAACLRSRRLPCWAQLPARQCSMLPAALYGALLLLTLLLVVAGHAQSPADSQTGDRSAQVLDGVIIGNAWGVGKSIKITGTVKAGAISFGGDVIVQGTVEGDVAAIGGSVIQL